MGADAKIAWDAANRRATPVDFCRQLVIYLLYDGREVIYVGRTTDRPLGKRLYEHTIDRMSARWDRFSWFGLLPVSDDGSLGSLPAAFDAAKLIPALEPRQNRKRGDDLAAVDQLHKANFLDFLMTVFKVDGLTRID